MDLYNCESPREKELKDIDLNIVDDYKLIQLTNEIHKEFKNGILEDENIVIDALYQIAQEALRRLATEKRFSLKMIEGDWG